MCGILRTNEHGKLEMRWSTVVDSNVLALGAEAWQPAETFFLVFQLRRLPGVAARPAPTSGEEAMRGLADVPADGAETHFNFQEWPRISAAVVALGGISAACRSARCCRWRRRRTSSAA